MQIQQAERHTLARAQRRARRHIGKIDAEVHQRLRDCRAHAGQYDFRTDVAHRLDRLDQVLRGLRVDRVARR